MATSIIEVSKKKLIQEMIRDVQPKSNDGWKILIVDQTTLKIISSCCTMSEMTDEKITVIEKIENARNKVPNEAIYFLTPTTKSIDYLINDFKKKGSPHYPSIHLYLTTKLPDSEFKKLASSNAVHKIRTMKELNIEYISCESQVFHFNYPHSLEAFYSKGALEHIEEQSVIASKLISFCVSINECPIIRHGRSNTISTLIASLAQEKMDLVLKNSKSFDYNEDRATLLILDRSQDPLTPLLHEFTYQAMVYDMFDIKNDIYKYEAVTNSGKSAKEVLLNETDSLWASLRHKHVADVSESLQTRLDDFLKTNQVTQYTKNQGGERSLKEASDVIRSLPQYQEMMSKYSTHIYLTEQTFNQFTPDLEQQAILEQDMATGTDSNGNTPKNIVGRLNNFLSSGIDQSEKIRLLMIYIISQEGIKEQDRKKLMDIAGLTPQQQSSIVNLYHLGVTILKGAKGKQKAQVNKPRKAGSIGFELSRYVPVIKDIVESLISNQLNEADFPYLREAPIAQSTQQSATSNVSLKGRANQPRWAEPVTKVEETKYTGSKLIIFVIGGMTYSEMRSIYELSHFYKKNIYIGSTGILLPKDYVVDIQAIEKTETM